ncbi:tyrosine-type recombinase/integrase [Peribacillus sp. NPDC097225]|uniref:tyrosine-type recombinase/integrase n=1 Tax=Peribacillus sp. NPDC097225 TaxID=3364400 RepID=UPI00382DA9C3
MESLSPEDILTDKEFLDFGTYLSNQNYASAESHMGRAAEFLNYLLTEEELQIWSLNEGHLITHDRIIQYESYLKMRISNNEITAHTAYKKLQTVRLLCKYLDFKNITSLNYSIPKDMIHASNESNYYFDSATILELINSIASTTSPIRSRDIAILLILVDIVLKTGTLQDPRNVLRVMKRLIAASNVTPIRFHDIRHTHASVLISEGVDIVKVAQRLGHANPKITLETYAHLMPNVDNDLADIFQNAIQKSR